MRRREFIALVGSAVAWPLAARGQQPAKIGFLSTRSSRETTGLSAAFQQGLQEMGFVQGANVDIDYRWADGRTDRLPALAEDLVAKRVSVIATGGGPAAALAAKSATSTIPIVFSGGSDPVAAGLVASINRPGGNVTGILNIASDLIAKRLELLRQIVPSASRIGALRNPTYPEIGHATERDRRCSPTDRP